MDVPGAIGFFTSCGFEYPHCMANCFYRQLQPSDDGGRGIAERYNCPVPVIVWDKYIIKLIMSYNIFIFEN